MSKRSSRIELTVEFIRQTDAAILVNEGTMEVWLPKSQVTYDEDKLQKSKTFEIELPEWLAEEKGLI